MKKRIHKTKSTIRNVVVGAGMLGSLLGVAGEHPVQPYAFRGSALCPLYIDHF